MAKRVLLVNKFYYPRGGDCVVMMNTEALLRSNGYEVAVFAMHHPETSPSEWSSYFASEVSFSGGMSAKISGMKRTLGMGDIKAAFCKILDDFKPDVVHLHNIHSYLSPVLAELAHSRGTRVVWTLHDYKLLCPAYTCTRDKKPCEKCFNGKCGVVKHRCMKGSLAASVIAWMEAKKWNRKKLESCTDAYICPSQFMAKKMAKGKFTPEKLQVICNFVDPEKLQRLKETDGTQRGNYYCYVGRLSEEKGVRTLLKAAATLPYELRVAGDGPLEEELRQQYAGHQNIKFLGKLNAEEVAKLLSEAQFSIMPSECYENNPLGVIESLCAGTPVIGAEIGGIPELIDPASGLTYPSGTAEVLAIAIEGSMKREWNHAAIKEESIERFSPETHLKKLTELYGF